MSNHSWNGLKNYPKIRKSISEVSKLLKQTANSKTSHLMDVVTCIGANISILKIHCDYLTKEFDKQKQLPTP